MCHLNEELDILHLLHAVYLCVPYVSSKYFNNIRG